MDTRRLIVAAAALLLACAPGNDDNGKPARPAEPVAAPADAAPVPPLVEPDPDDTPTWRPPSQPGGRGRILEITLRSTPPGATAAVDGRVIGPTPTFWRGKATGRTREFTFVLDGHAMARYRFVPTTNGVVHATLKPLTRDADAGAR